MRVFWGSCDFQLRTETTGPLQARVMSPPVYKKGPSRPSIHSRLVPPMSIPCPNHPVPSPPAETLWTSKARAWLTLQTGFSRCLPSARPPMAATPCPLLCASPCPPVLTSTAALSLVHIGLGTPVSGRLSPPLSVHRRDRDGKHSPWNTPPSTQQSPWVPGQKSLLN